MWAAEQGKRWHDWSAANQEKLRLGDVSAASSLRPSFGEEGRGRGNRSWGWGSGGWQPLPVSVPLSYCGRDQHGQKGKGEKGEMCSPVILGELSWEGSQFPLIKQAKRTRGKAVFKTPSTF